MTSNVIDWIDSSNCFIFAYPGYLTIAEAKYEDIELSSNKEKEIRIPSIILTKVVQNLLLVGKEFEKTSIAKTFTLNILETATSIVEAKAKTDSEDVISLILRTETEIKWSLDFNLHDYLLLLKGIQTLFFKPYGISFETEFLIDSIIEILKTDHSNNPFRNVRTWNDIFNILKTLFPDEKRNKLLCSSQKIKRYLSQINLYLKLTKKVDMAMTMIMECE